MTKTENLIEIIKKDEFTDSDYWFLAGNQGLQNWLLSFEKSDWEELKSCLNAWTSNQLNIFADILIYPKILSIDEDTNEMYGYIFTLVEDSEADYLLQEIKVLDDGRKKNVNLLLKIKQRISNLEKYTTPIHKVHDYANYFEFIDNLIEKQGR